jgi:hypothetical protein
VIVAKHLHSMPNIPSHLQIFLLQLSSKFSLLALLSASVVWIFWCVQIDFAYSDPPIPSASFHHRMARHPCRKYTENGRPSWLFANVISGLKAKFSNPVRWDGFLSSFFNDHPVRAEFIETRDTIKESLYAALYCNKMLNRLPMSTQNMLIACKELRQNLTIKYPGFTGIADEIICLAHGLRALDPRVLAYIRDRVAMDIGGFNGDSAVVLMDYVKVVYSFEPCHANFKKLSEVIKMNTNHYGSGYAFQIALSDFVGIRPFQDRL